MRAIQYSGYGAEPRLVGLPGPECPPDGVIVSVRATGVCRSDWHAWRGHDPVPLPMVPGHEFAGVVAATGPLVCAFSVGDRVTAPFVNGCGRCEWCHAGHAQVCPDQTQPGFTHAGSFAEQVVVRAADFNLVRLPDDVDFVTAASLGCRFATSYHALTVQGRLKAGEWLLVVGCGGVGMSAVMVGVALGARVLAVDPSPEARARATELGAESVLPLADPDAVRAVTGGGADVSLDAVGTGATAAAAVLGLRRRGRHVQVGLMLDRHADAPLPWGPVIAHELEVVGSHGMAAVDYPELLALITAGTLDPRSLVGRVVDLAEAGAALMALDAPVPAAAGIVVATL
ncbi:MAG: alcohol dehydrogenase [Actinobacteria bacterium HGW-Actinobacteria-5]|nr:MAG: alcohol dehydrogenase [Actinobacteria bacterium HGW-Actinobacteria-5]